jgi:peptide-methionine (S)-S-oxide reductase
MRENTETSILAGGCFWGMEELLRHRDGVISTRVGYTGGDNDNPTYAHHPGHAEAIEVRFDAERIPYRDVLELFSRERHRFGLPLGDLLHLRRTAPGCRGDDRRRRRLRLIADVDASGLWPRKVVTEVSAAGPFWEAEAEHQDYLQRYPNGYTCHHVRPDWKPPHREHAA